MRTPARAFTLIELLIVVSILAILASLALPNFLEAQARSKVARAKADMKTIATALEAYHTDRGHYPPSTLVVRALRLSPLSTPVAYLSSVPNDPFGGTELTVPPPERRRGRYNYGAMPIDEESRWALASDGPDLASDALLIDFYPGAQSARFNDPASPFGFIVYDPTNGTISKGDVWRVSDSQMP